MRYPSETSDNVLCSDSCRAEWLSKTYSGDGHPNWKGGPIGCYGRGWRSVRRAALDRDNHTYQVCGKRADEIGRNPDVHHIVPVRVYKNAERYELSDAHHLENVICLCAGCHRAADSGAINRRMLACLASKRSE
ncbi:HNH endonuclease [Halobaculum sp. EA56]|uniref:HNH endonuclease n=1 Tax=Halobaculum sp. EA56 TaxID=3421648 RepID=UPI003EB8C5F7